MATPKISIVSNTDCASYSQPGHPERPARIIDTQKLLRTQKELAIKWEEPSPAEDEPLLRAHTPEHLVRLTQEGDFDADTAWHPGIEKIARTSAGAGLAALRAARNEEIAFSLMRPPGHHATREQAMGFCYLSNIAIVALEALTTGSKRVAVFDFDVHHGNGTEDVLLNRPGTAFYSVHQYPCYPGTGGANVGNNCFNYPVPPYTPRTEYREILTRALNDLKRFQPDLVAISAGFDAYARDPLAQETLEAEDFHWLGENFRALDIPKVSLLEGGYSDDLPELIFAYLKGLAGMSL